MHPDTLAFLDVLFERCTRLCSSSRLTFTAIHPTGQQPTPSRHIPLHDRAGMLDTLQRISDTNRMGWGAYFAVGLRKPGLSRWKRGGAAEVVALPAFYTDIDDPTDTTLVKLRRARLPPSVIVHSGGGYHAYWLLDEPTTDLNLAKQVLQGLARTFGGDGLSPAQSLRLPGTVNCKPERGGALCHLVVNSDRHYCLSDFQTFIPPAPRPTASRPFTSSAFRHTGSRNLNRQLIHAITAVLYRDYAAREQRWSDWLASLCPCGHTRDSPGAHFFYVESKSKSRERKVPTNKDRAPLPKSTLDYLNYGSHVGQRNRTLFSSACQFRDAGYTLVEALTVLVARYMADSEPHEYPTAREQEARKTVQSAYARSPRPDITQFR